MNECEGLKENLDMQVIYGTRYVDEIVRYERNGYGTVFVFQDANWNVTGTVNYATYVLDRVLGTRRRGGAASAPPHVWS